jgi:hypothetical protein
MSTLKTNVIQNLSGVEKYLAQAWVNFNGTGTVAIRASGNVSSITDNGVGDWTVNFTVNMPDVNYAPVGCIGHTAAAGPFAIRQFVSQTVSAVRVLWTNATPTATDVDTCLFAVFR